MFYWFVSVVDLSYLGKRPEERFKQKQGKLMNRTIMGANGCSESDFWFQFISYE